MIKTSIALASVIFLTGCATGFNRQGIQQRLDDQPIEVTETAIKAALEKKSQIRFPIKLAVHMVSDIFLAIRDRIVIALLIGAGLSPKKK